MKLGKLINCVSLEYAQIEITSLAFDSEEVKQGSLFFCLNGLKSDGHNFVARAREKGARCAVVEKYVDDELPQILVSSSRETLSRVSRIFFGEPDTKLTTIGITGTNGKTSTAYMIKSILETAGKKVGMIGTNGVFIGKERFETKLTTPDPIEYNSMLALMLKRGVEVVVSEISAHSLALYKVEGIVFDIACFTNFSQEHLDFFKRMQNYKNAKLKLFTKEHSKFAIINSDDEVGREIMNFYEGEFFSYGTQNPADAFAIDEQFGEDGVTFIMNVLDEIIPIKSNLCGRFNVYNILCASCACYKLGISNEHIYQGIMQIHKVDGRFNIISGKNNSIIIDFAHTDDGLKNAINSIKEFCTGRIITVFGCGGDRDKTKRPLMGKVASQLSDYCILTSDNPRSEDPISIIEDIKRGIDKNNYSVLVKRKEAIRYALEIAKENDIIFIAGKGAEQYQEINGIKYAYNDEKYIMELIEENVII